MKFPVLRLSFVIELTKVIYLAWDLGSRLYITLHFCAKVVGKKKGLDRKETFELLSTQLFFQYVLMSDLTHRLIVCKAHLEDVNRKCSEQMLKSHWRKCKRVVDSLLSVLP